LASSVQELSAKHAKVIVEPSLKFYISN